jgi:hypothetical protein
MLFLLLSWSALVASITWDLRDANGNLIKDRQQWQNNGAYSAETSFIMAGMHLAGQYVSEYDVRAAANRYLSDCGAQKKEYKLRIPSNHFNFNCDLFEDEAEVASDKLKLRYEIYSSAPVGCRDFYNPTAPDVSHYLGWIKAQLRQGRAPIIEVYCKDCRPDYDYPGRHFMTAISYESTFNDDLFHTGDAFTICDHLGAHPNRRVSRASGRRLRRGNFGLALDLFGFALDLLGADGDDDDDTDDGGYTASDWQDIAANGGVDASSCTRIVLNNLTDRFFGSRYDAVARTSSMYTMPDDKHNSGIAHLGPVDLNNELLQVVMTSDKTFEAPEIEKEEINPDSPRPASMDLTLTITVKGLSTDTTKQYVLCLA